MAKEIFKYLIPIYVLWNVVHMMYFMYFMFSRFGENMSPFMVFDAPGFGMLMLSHALVIALGLAFMIYMVIDCAHRKFKDSNMKIVWILIIVLLNTLGSIVYFYIHGKKPVDVVV